MLHVLSRKVIVVSLLSLFSVVGFGQHEPGSVNYFTFHKKPYYFGLRIALISSGYKIELSEDFIRNPYYRQIEVQPGNGLGASVIFNLKLGRYFDFRVLPTVSFQHRQLHFVAVNGSDRWDRIESIYLELPVLLRYKSETYRDSKAFVIAGINYMYDVQSTSFLDREKFPDVLRLSPHNFCFEIGAGLQFFFPYFIFSPEIKFSQGLDNILLYDRKLPASNILYQLLSRAIIFSVQFEG